jgi:aryl-alcohol dehydrogenase-like predicted oxidoreductase
MAATLDMMGFESRNQLLIGFRLKTDIRMIRTHTLNERGDLMEQRKLGKEGPEVSAIGLGCMAMSEFYGASDDAASTEVIFAALEAGITMLDTADTYGHGHNEELIGRVLKRWGGKVFVASKFGIVRKKGEYRREICGRPEYVKAAVEASLGRLGRERIDLCYVHRVDANVAIEETVGALSDLAAQGKLRYIGLSEPSVETLRRAHAVHPITAVQSEYSLWTRDAERGIMPVCRELGIGFVAYSPLGRGVLTGRIDRSLIDREGDMRRFLPRFSAENFAANMDVTAKFVDMARRKGIAPSRMALAWILAKGDDIVPIPGTRRMTYLMENIGSTEVRLDQEEIGILDDLFAPGMIRGARYTPEGMAGVNQ